MSQSSGIRPTSVSATGADPIFVGPEAYTFWGPLYENEYKIGYEGEYLFRVPPRAFEGARASEGPWSLSILSCMESPPLGIMIIPLGVGRQSLSGDRSEHRVERDSLGRLFGSHQHIRETTVGLGWMSRLVYGDQIQAAFVLYYIKSDRLTYSVSYIFLLTRFVVVLTDQVRGMWKQSWPVWRYYSSICLTGLVEATFQD